MPSELLVVAIISADRKIHDEIAKALHGNPEVETVWTLTEYPDSASLAELRKATGGCIVFLDFADPLRAKAVAAEIDTAYPRVSTVALHSGKGAQDLMQLMQLGIREVINVPVTGSDVVRAFMRVGRKLKTPASQQEGGSLYAFLPAKPGAGATTLAVHTAAAAARAADQRTLLLDFDFRLGMTSFLFKLDGIHSVLDAISTRHQLGTELWDHMVCRRGKLDILGSAPATFGNVNPESGAVELVDLAREAYPLICVDLPGEMRDYEMETMSRAKEVFLVTTPDIGALHMARRKAEALHLLGLHGKTSVIMNRAESRGAMALRDVESILQLPVRFSIPAAEKQISEATRAGRALEGRSPLVSQIESIARRMSPGVPAEAASTARRFIELFSVSPVRDRATWGS